jgi:hypothetical protein
MAIVLKDFNHVTVVEHALVPSSTRFDLEDLLGNFDYKRIIKMQFDRVDNSFQEFLNLIILNKKKKKKKKNYLPSHLVFILGRELFRSVLYYVRGAIGY